MTSQFYDTPYFPQNHTHFAFFSTILGLKGHSYIFSNATVETNVGIEYIRKSTSLNYMAILDSFAVKWTRYGNIGSLEINSLLDTRLVVLAIQNVIAWIGRRYGVRVGSVNRISKIIQNNILNTVYDINSIYSNGFSFSKITVAKIDVGHQNESYNNV